MAGRPIFALLALVAPLIGGAWAYWFNAKGSADTIGGAIGVGLGAFLAFATVCCAGEILAIVSLVRGERPVWLGILAVIVNLSPVALVILFFNRGS